MKKILLSLTLLVSFYSITKAQQPMTIAPGLNITAPTAGVSGLKFNNLNSGTTVSATPTKVLSLDASGNVILGNAPAATTQPWVASGSDITFYTGLVGIGNGNPGVTANLDIYNAGATDATPQLGLDAGITGINITRFSGIGGSFGGKLYETVTTGSTNTAASVAWKHTSVDGNGVLTTTPMMTLTGAGNMTINGLKFNNLNSGTTVSTTPTKVLSVDATGNVILGNAALGGSGGTSTWTSASGITSTTEKVTISGFTKLGNEATTTTAGVTRSTPAIKTLMLTGSINVALATETSASLTTSVPHGLNGDKILSVSIVLKPLILSGNGNFDLFVTPNFTDNRPSPGGTNGLEFVYMPGPTTIDIIRRNGNSGLLARTAIAGTNIPAYGAPYKMLITYME